MDEEILLTEADIMEVLWWDEWEVVLDDEELEVSSPGGLYEEAFLLTEADLEQVLSSDEDAELLEQWFEAGERLLSENPEGISWATEEERARPTMFVDWLQSLLEPSRPRLLQEA